MNERKEASDNELRFTAEEESVLFRIFKSKPDKLSMIKNIFNKLSKNKIPNLNKLEDILTLISGTKRLKKEFTEQFNQNQEELIDFDNQEFDLAIHDITSKNNLDKILFSIFAKFRIILDKATYTESIHKERPTDILVQQTNDTLQSVISKMPESLTAPPDEKILLNTKLDPKIGKIFDEDFRELSTGQVNNLKNAILQTQDPQLCSLFLQRIRDVISQTKDGKIETAKLSYKSEITEIINNLIDNIDQSGLTDCALTLGYISDIFDPQDWDPAWDKIIEKALNYDQDYYNDISLMQIIPALHFFRRHCGNKKLVNKFLNKHEKEFVKRKKAENMKNPSNITDAFRGLLNNLSGYYSFKEEVEKKGQFIDFRVENKKSGKKFYVQVDGYGPHFELEPDGRKTFIYNTATLRGMRKNSFLKIPTIRMDQRDFSLYGLTYSEEPVFDNDQFEFSDRAKNRLEDFFRKNFKNE